MRNLLLCVFKKSFIDETRDIRRRFLRTSIYPLSFDNLIAHAKGVRDVPPEITDRAKAAVKLARAQLEENIRGKRKLCIVDEALIVDTDA
jgi:hypothetical protein